MAKTLVAIIGIIAICITAYAMNKPECLLGLGIVCVLVYLTPADEEDIDSFHP